MTRSVVNIPRIGGVRDGPPKFTVLEWCTISAEKYTDILYKNFSRDLYAYFTKTLPNYILHTLEKAWLRKKIIQVMDWPDAEPTSVESVCGVS